MTRPGLRGRLARDNNGYVEWVRLTDTALLVLALGFLGVVVLPYVVEVEGRGATALSVANVVIWAVFAADYVIRLYLARDRWQYVRRNWIDLLIVLAPLLRPLRAVRLLRLLKVLSVVGLVHRRVTSLHARVTSYVASIAVVVTVAAGFAIYEVERDLAGANIKTLPDAVVGRHHDDDSRVRRPLPRLRPGTADRAGVDARGHLAARCDHRQHRRVVRSAHAGSASCRRRDAGDPGARPRGARAAPRAPRRGHPGAGTTRLTSTGSFTSSCSATRTAFFTGSRYWSSCGNSDVLQTV